MGLIDYLGNNAIQIDPMEYENKVREKDPRLLQPDEDIVFAFKGRGGSGRDHYMLTTQRIIIRDKKGMTGKQIEYTSVPYKSIMAFSVESAGSIDTDQEIKLYAHGIGKVSIDLVKSIDIMPIYRFLNSVILQGKMAGKEAAGAVVFDSSAQMVVGSSTGFLDILGSNYAQIDNKMVESSLKSNPNILIHDEKVEMAFKCGRDSFILTSHRLLKIDVQGISGKKVEYLTILWPAIKGYSIETAGSIMDRDSELVLFFNLPDTECYAEGCPRNSLTRMKVDFRNGQADLFAIQRYISDKLLGPDEVAYSQHANSISGNHFYANSALGPHATGLGSCLAWLGDDNRMIDASVANRQFHSDIPILQACENVELAFRGRRDMLLFTTKRIVFVDMQGFLGLGAKIEFTSLPYSTVSAFSVRSAGSWIDKDAELCLWLDFDDVFSPPRENEDSPPPPIPRKSYIEIDFQKDKVDMLILHRYLSERVMVVDGHETKPYTIPVSQNLLIPSPPGTVEKVLDWIGGNAIAIDSGAVNEKFREAGLLQNDERVAFAFKTGRDSLYLTNKRIFLIDVQGFTGKRKEYMSISWDRVRSWSVESAGNFDRDMELFVSFKGFWNNSIKQDLRKGTADIFAIQSFIGHFVIGNADGRAALSIAQSYKPPLPGTVTSFFGLLNDAHLKDATELTATFRATPALLQADESIDAAFKCGRDLFLISTKRIIIVDKKGITGKSVEYKSYPLGFSAAFSIETEGHLLSGSEVKIYASGKTIKQELAKGQKDNIWLIHEIMSRKTLKPPVSNNTSQQIPLVFGQMQ